LGKDQPSLCGRFFKKTHPERPKLTKRRMEGAPGEHKKGFKVRWQGKVLVRIKDGQYKRFKGGRRERGPFHQRTVG